MRASETPIVIGGNGGSGTRVVARILQVSGVFVGADLNRSLDDLSFTLIFMHPTFFGRKALTSRQGFESLWNLHARLLLGDRGLAKGDVARLAIAGWRHVRGRYDPWWVLRRYAAVVTRRPCIARTWGFKEPHTALFLRGLHNRYPGASYVLVTRHGLDMAYSSNDQQFVAWGPSFGIDPSDRSPRNRFEFWFRFNCYATLLGHRLFGSRFLRLRIEDLCTCASSTDRLLGHASIDPDAVPDKARGLARFTTSYGRHLDHDLSWADNDVRRKLRAIGYEDAGSCGFDYPRFRHS